MKYLPSVGVATASALALCLLSGCSTYEAISSYVSSDDPNQCPDVAILANTSVLPAFDPAKGADPSNVTYTVFMTDISTRCSYSKRDRESDSRIEIGYTARRPPGGGAVQYRVPYFVAVTSGGKIIDKQIHWLDLEFAQGAVSAVGSDVVDSLVVKMARMKQPYDYHFLVGFQLTQSQIDYNKNTGSFAP